MIFGNLKFLILFGCVVYVVNSAAIIDNSVYNETPRIRSSDELISSIVDNCFKVDTMYCLKEKVINYLDTLIGIDEENGRSFNENNADKIIFNRLERILQTNEFKLQLPEMIFGNAVVSYRSDRGIDFELPKEEGRGHLLKKKLLFPVLLLLKLKMKALMPIIVALIGLKAIKALILSKLAIKLVLGFLIYNLIQKLGGLKKMSMMPMMPSAEPMNTYGSPEQTTSPTSSSYSAGSSWEPSGGPYSRWDTSGSNSAHNLAYSSYYPSSSSSGSSYTGSSSSGSSSSSPSSSSYSTYSS